jgi:allantoate deiminase
MTLPSEKVMQRCDILASFSESASGIDRRFLTPPVHDVHRALESWMAELGMSVRVDSVGNLIGRRKSDKAGDRGVLLLGSHLDTVPNAGKYDGILGVVVSLAVIETLKDDALPFDIDVIGFSEEEGVRFSLPFIGSRTIAGSFELKDLERTDENGVSLRQAIEDFGLDATKIPEAQYSQEEVIGYLETHIEQGPVLENLQIPLGIVEGIVGQSRLVLTFQGLAGHAGTVPMEQRRDALVGASKFVTKVQELATLTHGLRATVGRFVVSPNASNVIPDRVELSLDVRHADDIAREISVEALLHRAQQIANEEQLELEILSSVHTPAVKSSPKLVSLLNQAMIEAGLPTHLLSSGAGHDAMVLAEVFPTVMLFVRHPEGISHHPKERVDHQDVQVAMDVMVKFVRLLAAERKLPDSTK